MSHPTRHYFLPSCSPFAPITTWSLSTTTASGQAVIFHIWQHAKGIASGSSLVGISVTIKKTEDNGSRYVKRRCFGGSLLVVVTVLADYLFVVTIWYSLNGLRDAMIIFFGVYSAGSKQRRYCLKIHWSCINMNTSLSKRVNINPSEPSLFSTRSLPSKQTSKQRHLLDLPPHPVTVTTRILPNFTRESLFQKTASFVTGIKGVNHMILKGGLLIPRSSLMYSPKFPSFPPGTPALLVKGVDPTHHLQVSLVSDLHLSTTLRSKILCILRGIVVNHHRGRDGCWRFCLDFFVSNNGKIRNSKNQTPVTKPNKHIWQQIMERYVL